MDKKALTFPILISLVMGDMIGTGIYVLPASLADYGVLALLAWALTGVGALFLALTFSRLNKRFPKTGGPYVYCKEAYGRFVGFFIAYTYWFSNLVSIAGIAVASIGYLGFITPWLDANAALYDRHILLIIELGVIWLFTGINLIGIHTAGIVQLGFTVIKVLPLIIIAVLGLGHVHLANLTSFHTPHGSMLTALGSAAALTFWAFIGLEAATVPAENTPGHQAIYKATVWGTLATVLIYILCTFVIMGMLPQASLKNSQFPFAQAVTLLFGHHAALMVALCAVISGLGSLNVCILLQGQIVFAAARDGLFPPRFAKLSKQDVPVAGQLLSSAIVSLLLMMTIAPTLLKQFNNIALLAGLLTLITYFATTLSELKFLLQNKTSGLFIFFSRPSFWVTVLATLYAIWMITSFEKPVLLSGLGILLLAIPVYFRVIRTKVQANT